MKTRLLSKKMMLKLWMGSLTGAYLFYAVSCAPVQFSGVATAAGATAVTCTNKVCTTTHNDQLVIQSQPADILFVIDDSGSVSDVQANIAQKLGTFMQAVSGLDYRIGFTTTDISSNVSDTANNPPAAVNGNGAYQDGHLIQVDSSGDYFITPSTPNAASAFANTIQNPNTTTCVDSGYHNCPSGDPRGIYAANLLINNNYNSFLRPNVPLTVVIVSDSDERNSGTLANLYPQGNLDLPATLISNFQAAYPSTSLVVDAIIVAPGDTACYNQRYHRNGDPYLFAWYAPIYASLVSQTGGVLGSVCESDYTTQLGQIGNGISQQSQTLTLACTPVNNQYTVSFSPQPSTTITSSANWTSNQISFNQVIPSGTTVTVSYSCSM